MKTKELDLKELDAIVAEKVMGFKWKANRTLRSDTPRGSLFPVGQDFLVPDPERKELWKRKTGKKARAAFYFIPRYSKNISDAWKVVQVMREHGWPFAIMDLREGLWRAEFGGRNKTTVWADAASAPHAVCLAALEALGAS